MSSAAEKQHATQLIDAKRKFMQLMMRKPLYFGKLVRIDDVTYTFLKISFCGKMHHSRDLWFMLATFDVFGLSKIDSAKCTPSGFIIFKVKLFSMDRNAMKGGYNQCIKAKKKILSQKSSELKPQSDIRCNRFATSPRLTISTNRRGRNKVPDRSRRGCREVGD